MAGFLDEAGSILGEIEHLSGTRQVAEVADVVSALHEVVTLLHRHLAEQQPAEAAEAPQRPADYHPPVMAAEFHNG